MTDSLLNDLNLAIAANGGPKFNHKHCECDLDVGAVPCRYCAIFSALNDSVKFFSKKLSNDSQDGLIYGIQHQKQPTGVTCVQTCLAMALGVPVEKVIEKYGKDALNNQSLCYILTKSRIIWNQFSHGAFIYEGWHFASVPSLNKRGGMHQVLIHFSKNWELTVLDPSPLESYKQDGSDLISWSDLIAFIPGGQV